MASPATVEQPVSRAASSVLRGSLPRFDQAGRTILKSKMKQGTTETDCRERMHVGEECMCSCLPKIQSLESAQVPQTSLHPRLMQAATRVETIGLRQREPEPQGNGSSRKDAASLAPCSHSRPSTLTSGSSLNSTSLPFRPRMMGPWVFRLVPAAWPFTWMGAVGVAGKWTIISDLALPRGALMRLGLRERGVREVKFN